MDCPAVREDTRGFTQADEACDTEAAGDAGADVATGRLANAWGFDSLRPHHIFKLMLRVATLVATGNFVRRGLTIPERRAPDSMDRQPVTVKSAVSGELLSVMAARPPGWKWRVRVPAGAQFLIFADGNINRNNRCFSLQAPWRSAKIVKVFF